MRLSVKTAVVELGGLASRAEFGVGVGLVLHKVDAQVRGLAGVPWPPSRARLVQARVPFITESLFRMVEALLLCGHTKKQGSDNIGVKGSRYLNFWPAL